MVRSQEHGQEILSVKYGASLCGDYSKYIPAMFVLFYIEQCNVSYESFQVKQQQRLGRTVKYILPHLEDKNQIVEKGRRKEGRETRK